MNERGWIHFMIDIPSNFYGFLKNYTWTQKFEKKSESFNKSVDDKAQQMIKSVVLDA